MESPNGQCPEANVCIEFTCELFKNSYYIKVDVCNLDRMKILFDNFILAQVCIIIDYNLEI